MKRVVVVGGGLAGLVASIQLAKAGIACTVIEKKIYPFHRVCGEYISNEVLPFLQQQQLFPHQFNPPHISEFLLTSVKGKTGRMPLDLGGFGISRFTFDNFLYEQAKVHGVEFHLGHEADDIRFLNDHFEVHAGSKQYTAGIMIGAFGKRSKIDRVMNRAFFTQRSQYVGVKYHIRIDHPDQLIALHNFDGGYCGMSNIEDGKTTLCYLTHRDNLKQHKNLRDMEEAVLCKNPFLKRVFNEAQFLFDKPEVINEISFRTKAPVEQHVLMAGDAAGMIAPLCGNGMAMAIHSGKLLADLVAYHLERNTFSREQLEADYAAVWNRHFRQRLWQGRQIQKLFGQAFTSNIAVNLALYIRPIANAIMRSTHGDPF